MSTLTGNKISLTYKSLIKTSDNDVLTGALKELSDGLGNNSGVFLNTGGDLKSTGTLEFSNFKATAYAVTINKLVNEADGISNNDNDTSLPTSAAVKDYVDTHVTSQDLDFSDGTNPGAVDLDSQVFAIVGTSNEIETAASGQQLQIGLPNDVTISGTYTGTTFSGDLNGTINTATTAVTQTAGDNSTKVATTAYVDTLDAASDLDFSDGSVNSAVNLNTQIFSIQGTSNEITTTASGQSLTIALDSTGVDLPDGSTAITQTAGDNSTKVATTAYVDVLDAASDLDIAGDTGTGDVNLNTQTLTLQGTTNQVITAVSGQTTTFSLPSTVHRDLQGNVTGNADTATAWQTARDLSISGEATGTLSSVDGTSNISGAVTLTNSAVTGKVLTGLPTPVASTVQPSDSILEGIGKLQSQINGIANGLQFQGTWDAATNTPTLNSGGGEVDSGTTTGQTADKLIDSSQNFLTTVSVGDKVINQVDGQSALVTNVDSNTSLTLDADIMLSGEAYTIDASPFLVQGHYYVVSVGGTTSLNGNANWAIGDWVIAGADNIWSKLDHTQIDGQGTPGNLPVWNTATTLTDSIVSESGTALTVTGSLATTLGASVTGDLAINTDKFTVNATTGNTVIAGNLNLADDNKITVSTSNAFQIYYDSAAQAGQGVATISGGSHTKIGSTFFNLEGSGKAVIATDANNYVRLYHGGNQKLSTISTGVDITGAINADSADISGNATFAGSVQVGSTAGYTTISQGAFFTKGGGDMFTANLLAGAAVSPMFKLQRNDVEKYNIGLDGNDNLAFINASGDAKMSIDSSGNVGIGGTPTTDLDVFGNARIGSDSNHALQITDDSAENDLIISTTQRTTLANVRNIKFRTFGSNGTDNILYLNGGNGNVGIGVQPESTWYTGGETKALQIGGTVSIFNLFDTRSVFANNYYLTTNGSDTYINTDEATQYYQEGGQHIWKHAPSGTADTPITWTESMRIDSSGNVGIGTTDPQSKLHIQTEAAPTDIYLTDGTVGSDNYGGVIRGFSVAGQGGRLQLGTLDNGVYNPTITLKQQGGNVGIGTTSPSANLEVESSSNPEISIASTAGATNNFLNFKATSHSQPIQSQIKAEDNGDFTADMVFSFKGTGTGGALAEKTRITSGGNVGINYTSPFNQISGTETTLAISNSNVASLYLNNTSTNGHNHILLSGTDGAFAIYDKTEGANRFVITSGGVIQIGGSTNLGAKLAIESYYVYGIYSNSNRPTLQFFQDFRYNGTQIGTILGNNTSVSYNTSSDYRLKEDLQDFAGLDMVSKIPVYDFKWKTDESRSYGVMAHELQEVLPDAVSGDKDAEEMQGVDYSKIVPLLVKSIQELKAEVDSLKKECKCK
jgi:hypothetical protein